MARVINIHCTGCNQDKQVSDGAMGAPRPTICGECEEKAKEAEFQSKLADMAQGRTLEERVLNLERRVLMLTEENGRLRAHALRDMPIGL